VIVVSRFFLLTKTYHEQISATATEPFVCALPPRGRAVGWIYQRTSFTPCPLYVVNI